MNLLPILLSTGGIVAISVIAVLLLVLIIIVSWYISTLNRLRRMTVKIDESESSIDVTLTQRFDLLTKMFQAVKGAMKHESETLEKVIAMRQPASNAPMKEKENFANEVSRGLQAINVVVEQYPDLKANQNVSKLQDSISYVEENLQASRRVYNSNVSHYNQYILVFPSNFVANRNGFTKREFFEAEVAKRQDVDLTF